MSLIAYFKQLFVVLQKYHSIIFVLAARELRVRYKGSLLGFLWTFLNPLLMMAVYSVVFGSLLKSGLPHFSVYVFNGVLIWNALSGSMNDGAGCMASNASLITKAALPPEIIPARVVLTHYMNYLLALPLYFSFLLFSGMTVNLATLQFLYLFPLIFVFSYGAALCLAVIGSIFRDVQYMVNTIMFALFFTVPATYPFEQLPPKLGRIFSLSPLTLVVKMNADVLFYGRWLSVKDVGLLCFYIVLCFFLSLIFLKKYRSKIAERI